MKEYLPDCNQLCTEIHNVFLEYMDEIRQLHKLEYLHIQAPVRSMLTNSAIGEALCDKLHLECFKVCYFREKIQPDVHFKMMKLEGLSEAFKALFFESYIDQVIEYENLQARRDD